MASNAVQQYYVAVGSSEMKMTTLVDLLLALQANGPFGMAILCGSRDTLDTLVSSLTTIQRTEVHYLHSDLSDDARSGVLSRFSRSLEAALHPAVQETEETQEPDDARSGNSNFDQAPQQEGGSAGAHLNGDGETGRADGHGKATAGQEHTERPVSHVLLSTDAGMRVAESIGLPLDLALIVHYDLPTRKETYTRRLGLFARSAALKVAVYFVVAGEVAAFRTLEGFAGSAVIDVMPVHISDIFPSVRR
ncbi:g2751 [Coccomyxa elongata]